MVLHLYGCNIYVNRNEILYYELFFVLSFFGSHPARRDEGLLEVETEHLATVKDTKQ